jgi:hypothetical protein
MKRTAYSYLRSGSPKRTNPEVIRRQLAGTIEFCERHNLILSLERFEDLRVKKKSAGGALKVLLRAVKAAKISQGSVLVVENLGRFSRLEPRVAFQILAEIIESGVEVVMLADGKLHTKDTLDNFATLMTSLVIMCRADRETKCKNRIIKSALKHRLQSQKELATRNKRVKSPVTTT